MELNLNGTETVSNGTDRDHFKSQFGWKDAVGILLFGPIGGLNRREKRSARFAEDD